jgi:hypothetical protein
MNPIKTKQIIFYGILFLILDTVLITGSTAIYNGTVTISSHGIIITSSYFFGKYVDEIREVEILDWSTVYANGGHCNWTLIAETLATYNMTGIAVPLLFNYKAYYPSQYVNWVSDRDEVALAIEAARKFNLTVRLEFAVLYKSPRTEWRVKLEDGSTYNWLDPTNPAAREWIINLVKEVVTKYDIDDLCLDYIRYDDNNMPYTDSAKKWLEEYLGEQITDWPGPFVPGGSRFTEFLEFRMHTINTLVKEIYDAVKSIKPNVTVSADTRRWWQGNPAPHLQGTGQDVTSWVKGGYIDRLYPMTYVDNIEEAKTNFDAYLEYAVAGPEGAIPVVPYFSLRPGGTIISPQGLADLINYARSIGLDGFSIQAYGGPGDNPNNPDPLPDIRNYLEVLSLPKVWELYNITVQELSENSVIVKWRTTVPATSILEYDNTPLFYAVEEYWEGDYWSYPLHYWNLEHHQGIVIQNFTLTTDHQITLTNLETNVLYYFRVQCQNTTSKVYNFKI